METLLVDQGDGSLTVRTGVSGGAAKVGHSLLISMDVWRAEVGIVGGQPVSVSVDVEVDSLAVQEGTGGLRPLSGLDREMIHGNAVRSLKAKQHPRIGFRSTSLRRHGDAVDIAGVLTIAGETRDVATVLQVRESAESVAVSASVPIVQSDFQIKPYSLMFGQLRVSDEVEVHLEVSIDRSRL